MQRALADLQNEVNGLRDKVNDLELRNKDMHDEIKDLRFQLDIMRNDRSPTNDAEPTAGPVLYEKFDHPDGKRRRIPHGWKVPGGTVRHAYVSWHCGDPAQKIAPIKMLSVTDMSVLEEKEKKNLTVMKRMISMIDKSSASDEGAPPEKEGANDGSGSQCLPCQGTSWDRGTQ